MVAQTSRRRKRRKTKRCSVRKKRRARRSPSPTSPYAVDARRRRRRHNCVKEEEAQAEAPAIHPGSGRADPAGSAVAEGARAAPARALPPPLAANRLLPSLAARQVPVAAGSAPDEYDFRSPGVWGPVEGHMHDAVGDLGDAPASDAGMRTARGATAATSRLREQLAVYGSDYGTPAGVSYPASSPFAHRLAALAAMLDAGLPLRVVALDGHGGPGRRSARPPRRRSSRARRRPCRA